MKLPIIVAPMFLVSTPQMVIECCKAGIIGTFPMLNARPFSECEDWLLKITSALSHEQWGVNFINNQSENYRFEEDLELIKKYKPPIVISSLGDPQSLVQIVHEYGGKVYADVVFEKHAKKAAKAGVDGLILVCSGAGGHGGHLNPFAFIHSVKAFYEGEIILAGGISSGQDILAAKIIGADYVYMGTRFLLAEEGNASERYKNLLIESTIEDIVYTDAITGINANFIIPSLKENNIDLSNIKESEFEINQFTDGKVWKDIVSAGHGIGALKRKQTVKEIVEQLQQEFVAASKQYSYL